MQKLFVCDKYAFEISFNESKSAIHVLNFKGNVIQANTSVPLYLHGSMMKIYTLYKY